MNKMNWLGILEVVRIALYLFLFWSGANFIHEGQTSAALICFGCVGLDAIWVKLYLSRVEVAYQEATDGN